jgi:ParB/RepB/Spo0J family partition protein
MPKISISALKPSKINSEIYDEITDESVQDLVDSIGKLGLLEPIVVNQNHYILSGHRRVHAAKILGMSSVPYVVKPFANHDEEVAYLITKNMARVKTNEEKIREGIRLKEAYTALNLPGRVNDKVAETIGMSRRSFEKGAEVVSVIDELAEKDPAAAAELRARLGKGIDGAIKDAFNKKLDDIVTESIDEAEDEAAEASENMKYFYEHTLSVAKRGLEFAYAKLAARRNQTTPTALGNFIGNLKQMAERIETWDRDKMEPCQVCKGTGKNEDGNICTICVDGKHGRYIVNPL